MRLLQYPPPGSEHAATTAEANWRGRATLDVKIGLDGFPRGTKFAAKPNGDIFKAVTLNRGRPMVTGSEMS